MSGKGPSAALLSRLASHEMGLVRALGMRLVSLGRDRVRGRMPWSARASQINGLLHGGALAALADTTAGLGALRLAGRKGDVRTVEIKLNIFGNIRSGSVDSAARLLNRGGRSTTWEVGITRTGRTRLLALAVVTCISLPRSVP